MKEEEGKNTVLNESEKKDIYIEFNKDNEKKEINSLLIENDKNIEIKAKLKYTNFRNVMIEKTQKSVKEVSEKLKTSCYTTGLDMDIKDDFLIDETNAMLEKCINDYKKSISMLAGAYISGYKLSGIRTANLESQASQNTKEQYVYKEMQNDILAKAKENNPKQDVELFYNTLKAVMNKKREAEKSGDKEKIEKSNEEYAELNEEGKEVFGDDFKKIVNVHEGLTKVKENKIEIDNSINIMNNSMTKIEEEAIISVDEMTDSVKEAEIETEETGRITVGEFMTKFGKAALINTSKSIITGVTVGTLLPVMEGVIAAEVGGKIIAPKLTSKISTYLLENLTGSIIKYDDKYIMNVMDQLIEREARLMEESKKYIKNENAFLEGSLEVESNNIKEVLDGNLEVKDIKDDNIYGMDTNVKRAIAYGKKQGVIKKENAIDFDENALKNRDLEEVR